MDSTKAQSEGVLMISITFAGLPISCWQDPQISYSVSKKETVLLSGDVHVSLSTKKRSFPRTYKCYTNNYSDISALRDHIGSFDTLIISGVSYSDCYISGLSSIFEVSRGSGKWTYDIEFSQADQH